MGEAEVQEIDHRAESPGEGIRPIDIDDLVEQAHHQHDVQDADHAPDGQHDGHGDKRLARAAADAGHRVGEGQQKVEQRDGAGLQHAQGQHRRRFGEQADQRRSGQIRQYADDLGNDGRRQDAEPRTTAGPLLLSRAQVLADVGGDGHGEAIELIYDEFDQYNKKLRDLRDYYFSEVEKKIPDIKINGDRENRLPGNANVSFKGVNAQKLLFSLDELGICASAGSACSTGDSEPSHVLTSIGLSKELSSSTLRTSFGYSNTKEDIDFLVESLQNLVAELRK